MIPLRIRLQEWETLRPDSPEGRDLRGRQLTNDAARRAAVAETASERLIVRELAQGIELGATSYVGRVTFGDLEVTIEPKLAPQVLLRLFRYAFGLRNLRLFEPSTFRTQDNLFVDLVVAQLHAEVAELVSRGLSRRYVEEATELMSPRGRLDVNQFARGGGRLDRGLPCIVFPRSENHLLNQVLVGGFASGIRRGERPPDSIPVPPSRDTAQGVRRGAPPRRRHNRERLAFAGSAPRGVSPSAAAG